MTNPNTPELNFAVAVAAIRYAAAETGETPEDFAERALTQAKAEMTDETMRSLYPERKP